MLHRQVPLLGVREPVGIQRPIARSTLAIQVRRVGERRLLEVLRKAVLQQERRRQAAIGAAEADRRIETIRGHTSVPAGIEVLHHEDAVTAANHVLAIHRISQAKPRPEALVPPLFRIPRAVTGVAPFRARKREPSRTAARAGVRPIRVEERHPVVAFERWAIVVPAHAHGDGEFPRGFPGVAHGLIALGRAFAQQD